jgi:hypothetical protein
MGHSSHVHVGGHGEKSDSSTINTFELVAAFLLGIAGILTALSSFQAGLWNGQMSLHYGKANKVATAAAAETSRAMVIMAKDSQVDIQAKQQILEGNENPSLKERTKQIAGYLYVFQLSAEGYEAMGFPAGFKESLKSGDESHEADLKQQAMLDSLLKRAWEADLGSNDDYREKMLARSKEQSDEADKTFAEGVESKENADKFEFADVIFAISLFFAGISLIFHSNIRWLILGAGGVFLVCGAVYMATIHWTFS